MDENNFFELTDMHRLCPKNNNIVLFENHWTNELDIEHDIV